VNHFASLREKPIGGWYLLSAALRFDPLAEVIVTVLVFEQIYS
jgi:hypothetical protein